MNDGPVRVEHLTFDEPVTLKDLAEFISSRGGDTHTRVKVCRYVYNDDGEIVDSIEYESHELALIDDDFYIDI